MQAGLLFVIMLVLGSAHAGKGPLLRLSERKVDFGRVDQHQQVHKEITIRNEGDAPLSILKLDSSCGCTAGMPTDSTISPGKEVKLKISFSTGNRKGAQKKSITLHTNDPAEPKAVIQVLADVHPFVRLSEERLQLPKVNKGEITKQRVHLSSDKGLGLKLLEVTGGSAFLKTSFGPEASEEEEDAFWIDIETREILVIGSIVSYFEFETESRVRVPTAPAAEQALSQLRIVCDGSRPYRLVDVESPVPFLSGQIIEEKENTYILKITRSEGAPTGRFQQRLKVKTTDPDQPVLDIDVQGLVRR
jgi:hypothetical protein